MDFGGILLPKKKCALFWPDSESAEQMGVKPASVQMHYPQAKQKFSKDNRPYAFSFKNALCEKNRVIKNPDCSRRLHRYRFPSSYFHIV